MKNIPVFFLIMCVFFQFEPCHAYFFANDHAEDLRIDHTPYESPVQGNNPSNRHPLKLYDNFSYTDPVYFLTKGDDAFVFVEQVPLDIPLKLLSRTNILPENAIDRMVAANLRLKASIEEYQRLQKKALVLLGNSRKIAGKSSTPSQKTPLDIKTKKKKLEQTIQEIAHSVDMYIKGGGAVDPIIVTGTYSHADRVDSASRISKDNGIFSDGSGFSDAGLYQQSGKMLNRQDTRLPWVFEQFFKFWKFVMDHRIDIITYMLFILLTGFFISLRVKK